MPPESPQGPTGGRCIHASFTKRIKKKKNITRNMTISMCHYAFKTNGISTISCRPWPPHAKFETLGLSVAVHPNALVD